MIVELNKRSYKGLTAVTDSEIYYNSRIKYYNDGGVSVTFSQGRPFRDVGFVNVTSDENIKKSADEDEEQYLERLYKYRKDSVRRSKNKIFDIVRQNEWDYFFTGTLAPDCGFDRHNADMVAKYVNKKMYNFVARGKVIRYCFVPEEHENGAIHYHGFIKIGEDCDYIPARGKNGKYIFRGTGIYKRPVFNWLDWDFGFTTLIAVVGSVANCAKYITKYITKSADCPMKHRYYAGGDLIREVKVDVFDVEDFESIPLQTVRTEYGNFKYISFDSYFDFITFFDNVKFSPLII